MKRLSATALVAAFAALANVAPVAHAGEIVLFTDSDFCGDRFTVRQDAYDLNGAGLNDRVSSVLIYSGVWQLCEHRDYGGRCIEVGPGEYRTLPDFNDVVSSVREVGPRVAVDEERHGDRHRDRYRDDGRASSNGSERIMTRVTSHLVKSAATRP